MTADKDHCVEEAISDSAALGRLVAILADSGIAFSVRPAAQGQPGFFVAVDKADRRRLSRAVTAATRPAKDLDVIADAMNATADPRQFAKLFGPPGDQILITLTDDSEDDVIRIQTSWNSRVPGFAICSFATDFTPRPGTPRGNTFEAAVREFHSLTEEQLRKKIRSIEAENMQAFRDDEVTTRSPTNPKP